MEIVRLFNNHSPNKKMQEEFFLLGTAGKFADDIGDIFSDIKRNHLNLFCSLVNDNPAEKEILYKGVNDNVKINFRWLNQNCYSTYTEYIKKMESFTKQITSKKLRLVFQLSIIPAIWGIHLDSEHIAVG
jgi:lipase chaperone LimK